MRKRNEVIEGQKYGRLTIIKEVPPIGHKRRILCKCDCGNIKEYSMDRVIHGRTQSCGEGKYPYPCKKCPFNEDVYLKIK